MESSLIPTRTPRLLLACGAGVLAIHVLLPIGNSFPPLHLGPIPIHVPMVVFPFFVIPALRLWPLERTFRTGFTLLVLLSLIQAASLPYSERAVEGAYEWALDVFRLHGAFLVAWYLVARMTKRALVSILTALLVCAALLGIAERLGGQPLWPYNAWYTDFYLRIGTIRQPWDLPDSFRVWGTLGNPVSYCSLMMLGLPWAAALERPTWRWASIGLLLVAAALTLSRTIFLFAIPFGCFALISLIRSGPRRALLIGAAFSIVAVLVAVTFLDAILELWELRLTIESLNEAEGVSARTAIVELGLRMFFTQANPLYVLLGRGQGSGALVAQQVLYFLDTMDNEYLGFLYQNGLMGLAIWLLFWANYLRTGFAQLGTRSLHTWAIVGYMLAGVSFEIHRTFALNLLAFLSLAWITLRERNGPAVPSPVEPHQPTPPVTFEGVRGY